MTPQAAPLPQASAIAAHAARRPSHFKQQAAEALASPRLKLALDRTAGTAEAKRAVAVAAFPGFEEARIKGAAIKDHVLENLDHYLETFAASAEALGTKVHWARGADEACRIAIEICRQAGAKSVTRAKSMLGEEIGLPHALEAAGIERVETDLAEHIVQLAGDPPSHIVWPAMHKTREEVAELFATAHGTPQDSENIPAMVESARRVLRTKFLGADVGFSGANFLIADSGAVCTVTNEGNAELTTTPPRVHIVTAGIEKLVPSLDHAMTMLRLLVRSATGAEITQYTTFHAGPKRPGDLDGPEEMHVILVDNGRSKMLGEGMAEMLRCIRCGACMNHCVVFRQIGGHAYGGVYPGPMGSVLTPVLDGLKESRNLPQACTLNGKCLEVCPVKIPLPTLLRGWRIKSWREGLEPKTLRVGIGLWAFAAKRPWIYRLGVRMALPILRLFGKNGWIHAAPLLSAWTNERDFPAPPAGGSFMSQYKAGRR